MSKINVLTYNVTCRDVTITVKARDFNSIVGIALAEFEARFADFNWGTEDVDYVEVKKEESV